MYTWKPLLYSFITNTRNRVGKNFKLYLLNLITIIRNYDKIFLSMSNRIIVSSRKILQNLISDMRNIFLSNFFFFVREIWLGVIITLHFSFKFSFNLSLLLKYFFKNIYNLGKLISLQLFHEIFPLRILGFRKLCR